LRRYNVRAAIEVGSGALTFRDIDLERRKSSPFVAHSAVMAELSIHVHVQRCASV
jgi:hypothetical protein